MKKIVLACHLFCDSIALAALGVAVTQPVAVQAQSTKAINIKGKIGGKYAFTMHLNRTRSGEVFGYYYYGNGKNGNLTVGGTRDSKGNIHLTEYNPQGEKCGSWNIIITRQGSVFRMSGSMVNYKGQTFPLSGEQF